MKAIALPETVKVVLAELLERSLAAAARGLPAGGSFVAKKIGPGTYWYWQRSEGAAKRQHYLGPESPALLEAVERAKREQAEAIVDRESLEPLVAMAARGGAFAESPALVKVLELLAETRVFRLGGVLVGTPAFAAYGNLLGYRFADQALRTQDVDIAQDPRVALALAGDEEPTDVGQTLRNADPPFLPIPALEVRRASTSFSVRGRELRVDFLTPLRGKASEEPVYLPLFKVAAQPLRLLDYLVEGPAQAAIFDRRRAVLVQVPDPARFAWHKLWVAHQRGVSFQNKARKDVLQAAQLLELLLEDRPDDVKLAWQALRGRSGVLRHVFRSLGQLPGLRSRLANLLGENLE